MKRIKEGGFIVENEYKDLKLSCHILYASMLHSASSPQKIVEKFLESGAY